MCNCTSGNPWIPGSMLCIARNDGLAMTADERRRLSPWPMQLHRQAVDRIGHVAPLREPAAGKAKRQIGPVDAVLAQAHSGGSGVARAARAETGCVGKEQIFTAVRRAVAKCAHRQSVLS